VIGGTTVLTGLAWWTVSVHFLVSMVLVWLAVLLVRAAGELDGPATPVLPPPGRGLITLSTAALATLLVAGTLVTAAGPHAGDARTPRLDVGVPGLAQLHADLVVGYLGLLVGLGFLLAAVRAPAGIRNRFLLLVAAVIAQGALGATQYALGVPEVLVSLHVLGASLVTAAAAALWSARTLRPRVAPLAGRVASKQEPVELNAASAGPPGRFSAPR
jgi:cytochrome c oxidase assembly protein subunit 15